MSRTAPCVHSARVSWANLSSAGRSVPASSSAARAGVSVEVVGDRGELDAGRDRVAVTGRRPVRSPSVNSRRPAVPSGSGAGTGASDGRPRGCALPRGRPPGGRGRSCRAGSIRPAASRRRRGPPTRAAPIAQPERRPGDRCQVVAVDPERELIERPTCRARRGREAGALTRATPPSPASPGG